MIDKTKCTVYYSTRSTDIMGNNETHKGTVIDRTIYKNLSKFNKEVHRWRKFNAINHYMSS
ncbi:hypothetical protein LME05_15010 [Leuconostoc mesenteroides subsp. cremoris]|nr:hypothetical protein LME05_15010 [Leuconostoc mesenteroides subsp. cremoris]